MAWLGLAIPHRYGPCRPRIAWSAVARAALFGRVLWVAGSALFSFYVSNFDSYSRTYGSVRHDPCAMSHSAASGGGAV